MTRLILVAQVCLLPLTLLLGSPRAVHAQETWTTLPTITTSDTTGEKPQSKVWFHGHTWWAVLPTNAVAPTGTWLFRLEPNNTWTPVLQVTSLKGKADTRAVGNLTHVLVAGTTSSQLVSLEYVPASNTYQLWSVRPTPTSVFVGETGTIEVDSTNRMWLATDSSSAVEVYYSDYPYSTFTGPLFLATDTGSGQISAIAALPNNTIGVFWTNFAAQRWGFRAHVDGTDPTAWLADEAPGWALHPNQNMADDHVNLAVASDGTLYAAVKAGHASSSIPLMYLLVRHPGSGGSGTWDDIYTVGNSGTRPALVLNEDTQKLQVFISQSGGIYLYESAKWPISFGPGQLALSGTLNDPTSTKDTWAGRLVMLASNGGTHGLLITSVQGLVGSWKMNEGSGSQLRDTSGWGNNATLSGSPAWTPVLNGYALTLNGSTHGVVSDQANLNLTTALTLTAWVKPNLLATQDVISRATFGSVDGYALSLLSNGKASVHFNQASFGDIYRLDSTTSYPTSGNTWMHIAATYNGSTMRLYVNGVEENWTPGPAAIAANLLSVGIAGQANGSRRFRGDMDDVRVYNYALTPAEVATLANNGPVKADLMVTKSDSVTTVYSGLSTVIYNIQVTNLGPSNVAAATVSDTVSSKLTGVTWTCTASTGSSCTASGSGSINDPISLEAGDSAYYTLQGTVSGSATGTLSNTVSVIAPGVNDPVPGNNSATDVDTIEQAVAPSISVQPANVTVTQPNSATFSVTASGTTPLSYQWRRNGVAISGAISSSYVLNPTSAATDNGAQYSVVVSNIAGNVTSTSATLTVNVMPSITTQPVSTTVTAPNQATFTVVAAGTAPLSYQWRRNGANISGATNASYVLNPTAGTDNGAVFSVVVTNVAGSVTSANATLTVNVVPGITTQPANVTVTVPGAASFSVVATGTAPLSYQWRRNGTNISGATNASYVLNPTALSDNGAQFSVVVTNVAGNVTSAVAILTATSGAAPPSITTQPSSVTVTEPAAANFSVVATGDAPLSYQWKRNGTNISGATSSSYSLTPTAVTDTGAQFSVAVSNAAGSVTSSVANLTVNSSGGGGPTGPIFDVHFDTNADGFTYLDDTFRGTSKPNYASGNYIASGAYTGGGLRVLIGGINSQNIQGMSGGWRRSFTLAVPTTLTISFRYRLTEQNTYETDEYSQALFSLDSTLIGVSPNDYLAQVVGGGPLSTGWQLAQFNLGTVAAGNHTITLGGFNNQKTYPDEFVEMFFDDVLLAPFVPIPPSITTQPANLTVTEPGAANFSVVATGDAPLSYQWRRNGVNISGATSASYALNPTAATADNGAQFSVLVTNGAGSATSATATLTVNPPPVPPGITTQPASLTVTAPNAANFSVVATGDAPLSYQWRRYGVAISGATSASYAVNPTAVPDSGSFDVIVSNAVGNVTSTVATLTVNPAAVPPSITTQPASITVTAPNAANFSVVATGDAPLSYQWKRNGVDIGGAINSTYSLNPTAVGDSGAQFTVAVSNAVGTVTSAIATLTVNPAPVPPSITTQPSNVTVTEPAGAGFSVAATGDAPMSYQWRRNGSNISGATSASYTLNPTAAASDNGAQFDVVVSNAAGSATSTVAALTVQGGGGGGGPIFDVHFDATADGFTYADDLFRGTNQPSYAVGAHITSGGFTGGALRVNVGGVNNTTIVNMSGGWQRNFVLAAAAPITLSFRYRLTESAGYEDDELSQMLMSLDGVLHGIAPNDYIAQVVGEGTLSTGWQLVQINLGTLSAGSHTLALGGYNNKKTTSDEIAEILIDDLLLTYVAPTPPGITTQPANVTVTEPAAAGFSVVATGDAPLGYQWRRNGVAISGATSASYTLNSTSAAADNGAQFDVVVSNVAGSVTSTAAILTVQSGGGGGETSLFDVHFTTDADGFAYQDDLFRGTNQPIYAAGNYIASGGYTGGALRVSIGGINSQNVANMSGGWHRSFTLGVPTAVTLSFRYRLTETAEYEVDEFSQMLVTVDGVLHGISPNDYIAQVVGGGPTTTGWQLVQINLGTLAAGTHSVAFGGYNNQKTYPDESVEVLIDDVAVIDATPAPPSITTQPSSLTVTAPDAAGFSVVASGAAPLSYQWRRSGVPISGATGSSYTLNPTAVSDSGAQFDVVVSNPGGTGTSSAATLTVNPAPVPPSITMHPASMTVTAPDAANFAVVATGDAPLSYQWRRYGVAISGATSATYAVNPTAVADSGSFDVVVSNAAGTVTSNAAALTVNPTPVPPGITTQPASLTVTEPAPANFSVVATGDAPLSYQWRRDGSAISGATSASYALNPTAVADNGALFDVIVSNAAGTVTSTVATLTVNPAPVPPSITTQPASLTLTEPNAANFAVVATGDAPLSYQWRRNGSAISGATSATYAVNPTAVADSGSFDVVVSNAAGTLTSAAAVLTVNAAPVPPSITTPPANLTVTAPNAATFSVIAAGDAPLNYQWQRDGVDISGAIASSYTLDPTAVADTGAAFRVVVSNAAGTLTSAAAVLTVNPAPVPPSITTQPANLTVTAPAGATFSVVATGDAPLSYQWQRDGVDIAGATSTTYILDPTAVADNGAAFRVVVSNGAGTLTSAAAVLTVNAAPVPPSITTPPANLTVTAPGSATFSVVATGDAPLSYQWQRDGVDIAGASNSSYTLNPTATSDSGAAFRVVVSNSIGTITSAAAVLTVNPAPVPPSITTPPANLTVTAPGSATFSVVATGDAPLSYQWQRDGVDIAGATSTTYTLDPTAVADNGAAFRVVVSNGAGTLTSAAAVLTVNPAPVPPSITTPPANLTVTAPGSATFSVVATGDAPLSYQWQRDGVDIAGATSTTYTLDPTAVADSGAQFRVVVSNSIGTITSAAAMLTVNPTPVPPGITTQPASQTVTAPAGATLSVVATGDAPISYQWRRNGSAISGATSASYVLDPTAVADSGQFDVIVSNAVGSLTSAVATLTVNPAPVPPGITTQPANLTVTAPNAATFSVEATGDAPLSYQWQHNGVDIAGATSSSYTLTPTAMSDSGAAFRVVVSNGAGTLTSAAAVLTVNPAPPSINTQPSSLAVTAPGAATFSVVATGDAPLSYQWRRNGVDIAGATSSSYTLDPTALGDSGALFSVAVTNGAGTVTSASATLTVNIAPGITTQPANVTVTAPASATFTVVTSGTAPFTYQWRRNGVVIGGATGASYILNPTAGSDSGATFDVVVSNAAGSVTSATATLTVNVAPGITTQPANLTVTAPASATFSVVATGTSLTYQWRRNGVAISGATSASYVLNPTGVTDSGSTFDVVVSNVAGTVTSSAATLTVQPGGVVTLIDANFNTGSDGFAYLDDLFRSTVQPTYANGTHLVSGGFSGGGIQVLIGGVNGQNIANMSGGWQHGFNLAASGPVTLTLRYKLSMVKSRTDRFGQVLASIDGILKGISPADYIVQLAGTGGGGTSTTEWQQVQINLGTLSAGNHTLSLGGFMTRKSATDETAVILLDDVVVTAAQ